MAEEDEGGWKENAEELEEVGFGCTGPRARKRALRARSGSEASRAMAFRSQRQHLAHVYIYNPCPGWITLARGLAFEDAP